RAAAREPARGRVLRPAPRSSAGDQVRAARTAARTRGVRHRGGARVMNPERLPPWWDPYSCQPRKLAAGDKPRVRVSNIVEYLKVAATAAAAGPVVAARYFAPRRSSRPAPADFVALSVTPDDALDDAVADMVAELGVR